MRRVRCMPKNHKFTNLTHIHITAGRPVLTPAPSDVASDKRSDDKRPLKAGFDPGGERAQRKAGAMASFLEQLLENSKPIACLAGALTLGCCASKAKAIVCRPDPTGPLAGVKILDVSVVIAAPFAAAVRLPPGHATYVDRSYMRGIVGRFWATWVPK
jgi:hypothetical protein